MLASRIAKSSRMPLMLLPGLYSVIGGESNCCLILGPAVGPEGQSEVDGVWGRVP